MKLSELSVEKHRRNVAKPGRMTITIGRRGTATTPNSVFEAMGSPAAIEILYDRQRQILALRGADANDPDSYPVRQVSGNGKTRTFSLTSAVNHFGIDVSESRRYEVEMDGETVLVDLSRPPLAVFDTGESDTDEAGDAQQRLAV